MIRKKLAKVWYDYGGGFYGLIAAGTFLYLEWIDLVEDVARAGGILELFDGGVLTAMLGFMMDALMNALAAMLWPIEWLELFGYWIVPILVGLYGAFSIVRPHLESSLPKPPKTEGAELSEAETGALMGDPAQYLPDLGMGLESSGQAGTDSSSGARNRPV